jgi:hypothetical protein
MICEGGRRAWRIHRTYTGQGYGVPVAQNQPTEPL